MICLFPGQSTGLMASLIAGLMLAGCSNVANFTSVHRRPDINDGRSLVIDNEQAAILVTRNPHNTETFMYCAQPQPDGLSANSASGSVLAELVGGDSAEGSASAGESVGNIGLRTQSIQLLRDAFYRVCESYANGGIDDFEYGVLQRRFQANMMAILAIEQLSGTVTGPGVVVNADGSASTEAANAQTSSSGAGQSFPPGIPHPATTQALADAVEEITTTALNRDYTPQLCFEFLRLYAERKPSHPLNYICMEMIQNHVEALDQQQRVRLAAMESIFTMEGLSADQTDQLLARLQYMMDPHPVMMMPAPVMAPVPDMVDDGPVEN